MINITDEQLDSIRSQFAAAKLGAVGYRLMVKPIPARKGMEQSEASVSPTLAAKGFEVKTTNQKEKETKGSDVGIVVHVGADAYKTGQLKDTEAWAKEGDVVIFPRYIGHQCEIPPGSGEWYHFMTDDDLMGKYEGIEL